jgi:hypothetical protein
MRYSASASTEEVASSRMRMRGSARMARASEVHDLGAVDRDVRGRSRDGDNHAALFAQALKLRA